MLSFVVTVMPEVAGYAVEMRGISKRFDAVQALDHVDLCVEAGTIHGLVGENGAGKTTLMRILYGAIPPDQGSITLNGVEGTFRNSAEAIHAGVGMVSQHYSVIPELTALQNLMLGAEPGLVINREQAIARADELATRMGFSFDWNGEAAKLSPAGAQKLEILKLLWRNSRIMILDEPTAMLSPVDSEALFGSLHKLTEEGSTVILVTHRLPEVLQHCKRVTVLRDGRRVTEREVVGTTAAELAEAIVGRSLAPASARTGQHSSRLVLDVKRLFAKGARGEDALKGIDLMLHGGELLGIAGVDGSGQRELFHSLLGTHKIESGRIVFGGEEIAHYKPRKRIELGLRLIPEDRHEEGLVEEWSLEENAALGLHRLEPITEGRFINTTARRVIANEIADRLRTRHAGLGQTIGTLSGGNQQRFLAGRALAINPKLILAFQPARGMDIEATGIFYDALRQECSKGAAAIVVSFDLDELLENCDRIVVMNRGRLHSPMPSLQRDRAEIGKLMVGAA